MTTSIFSDCENWEENSLRDTHINRARSRSSRISDDLNIGSTIFLQRSSKSCTSTDIVLAGYVGLYRKIDKERDSSLE